MVEYISSQALSLEMLILLIIKDNPIKPSAYKIIVRHQLPW